MKIQPGYLERTQGFIAETTYKNPLRNIIKELSTRTQIDPEIETRLDRYIEDRHLLVHRWFIHYGWPDDDDLEQWTSLQDHADRVGNEAQELTRYFAGYIVRFAETEWAKQNPDEYDAKISGLFQVAGSG